MLRRARMPAFLVTTLALMYRYLFVLGDEAQRMRAARASRTFARGRVRVWRALGTVIAQLFVRSTERAEALIGPNGAGKSTLLLHFNGILPERHDGPAVRIFGEPVVPEALERIRRKVGLLFQDPDDQLFCPTVHEDVAFGPEQFELSGTEVRRIVAGAPARVWLTGFESRAPHHRSAGEKRRVCLAGVLACEPAVLLDGAS